MKLVYTSILFILAVITATVAVSVLLAGLFAFNAEESVVAIESLFGSLIAALLFGALSIRLALWGLKKHRSPK